MSSEELKLSPRLTLHTQNGKLDEIFGMDDNGDCEFHMEAMSDTGWWMRWYSTKARPLSQELIVNLAPVASKAFVADAKDVVSHDFDDPATVEDERHISPEFRTPPEKVRQEVEYFIQYFGMERLLHEIAAIRNSQSNC